jgi:hypothetical protein
MGSDAAAGPDISARNATLCTACGLCCDGSLFEAVRVDAVEIAPLEQLGLAIERGDEPRFNQPCTKLIDRCCSIYAARPRICRNFACALLKRLHKGDVTLDQARGVVATAQTLRARVAEATPPARGIAASLAAAPDQDWVAIVDPAMRLAAARRHLDQMVLRDYLATHFRLPGDKPGAGGGEP